MTQPFDSVILVAHGARDARWTSLSSASAAELEQERGPRRVLLAFMEFAPPSFADCTRTLHAEGGRVVLVAPIFLSGGGHVAKDIPELVAPERCGIPICPSSYRAPSAKNPRSNGHAAGGGAAARASG